LGLSSEATIRQLWAFIYVGKSNPTPLQINSIVTRMKETYYQQWYTKIINIRTI